MKTLCARALRSRRRALGITQKELAFYLGLHKDDIERMESADAGVSDDLLARLGGALSCGAERLLVPPEDALTREDMEALLTFARLTPEKRRAVAEIIRQLARPL